MSPEKITFYVYAETEQEARQLEEALHDCVLKQYQNGVLITARKLTDALRRFGNSIFITQYMR